MRLSQSRLTFLFVLFSCLAAMASALEWERLEAAVTTQPRQETTEMSVPFRNAGSAPVTIKGLYPSCDCTSADANKKTFSPDERGEIKVHVAIEAQTGKRTFMIQVRTDEQAEPVFLVLRAEIPTPVEASPHSHG